MMAVRDGVDVLAATLAEEQPFPYAIAVASGATGGLGRHRRLLNSAHRPEVLLRRRSRRAKPGRHEGPNGSPPCRSSPCVSGRLLVGRPGDSPLDIVGLRDRQPDDDVPAPGRRRRPRRLPLDLDEGFLRSE
jgi:hypothetical protein